MKRLFLGAVVAVLCAMPGASRAEAPDEKTTAVEVEPAGPARAADAPPASSEEADLAARDRAAPEQVREFSGGADGVYITSGAIAVALLVVLLIAVL